MKNAESLPVAFSIEYDPDEVDSRAEITLQARVEVGDDLLYINDTVHPVLTEAIRVIATCG